MKNLQKFLVTMLIGICLLSGPSLQANDRSCCFTNLCNLWCWDNIYVEVDGGFTTGLGKAKNSYGVGSSGHGMSTNALFLPGWNVEGKIGLFWCPWLRTEACYTFFRSRYTWDTEFGGNTGTFATTSLFDAELNVHTALFNAYLLLDRLFCCQNDCCCSCVSPYFMGGIGAVWNDLHDINEWDSPRAGPVFLEAQYHQHTHANFAARFGLGFLANLICGLQFDAGVHVTYIGIVQTGTTADVLGVTSSVVPHVFRNNWLGSFDIGLSYMF